MDMIRVTSLAISAIGYDPASMRMKIQFVQGHIYDLCSVPTQKNNGGGLSSGLSEIGLSS